MLKKTSHRIISMLLVLILCIGMLAVPVYAEDSSAAENQTETESQESAAEESEGSKQNESTEDPYTAPPAQKGIEDALVQVITGYEFSDGTVDVWISGTGIYVGSGRVLTALSAVTFADLKDKALLNLMDQKRDQYKRVSGIALDDPQAVLDAFRTYVCLPDGTYAQCEIAQNDLSVGISLIKFEGYEQAVSTMQLTEKKWPENVTVMRYEPGTLEETGDAIAAGEEKAPAAVPVVKETTGVYQDNKFTYNANLGRGLVGAAIVNDESKLLAIAIDNEQNIMTVVTTAEIKDFLEGKIVNPGTDPEGNGDVVLAEELSRLELAVTRAKQYDTDGYTEETVKAYQDAITNAEAILIKTNPSLEEIAEAGTRLNNAKNALEVAPKPEVEKSFWDKYLTLILSVAAIIVIVAALLIFLNINKKKYQDKPDSENEPSEKPKRTAMEILTKLLGVTPKEQKASGEEQAKLEKPAKEKKQSGKKNKKSDEPVYSDGRYGGELARESEQLKDESDEEEEEAGTSVLGAGASDTTVLKRNAMIKAYLTDANDEKIEITKREFVMGKERRKVTYCIVGNPTVSRQHCVIKIDGDSYAIEDLKSLNGTYVNGTKIAQKTPVRLSEGDRITLSDAEYTFHLGE